MDLHNVRESLHKTLSARRLSRKAFATKHGISLSWLNGFAQGEFNNPRYNSLKRLEEALKSESGMS